MSSTFNNKEKESNIPESEKSHWEKYEIYYLVFGGFFLTLLFIFVANNITNNEIGKINERLAKAESTPFAVREILEGILGSLNGGSGRGGGNNNDHDGQVSTFEKPDPARQNRNWIDDLIVQKSANKSVKRWVNCFKFLPQFLTREQELDKHALFSGPPGTGKSFIIEEFCQNESSGFVLANFETQIWAGSSIQKQQKVFQEAKELLKKNAVRGETKPVVIVIEEIDSVGMKDLSGGNRSSSIEVDGLLKIFDEINRGNLNIIIIATTNNPEMLDKALVRPGRLGRRVYVNYPAEEETQKLVDYLQEVMKKNWRSVLGEKSEGRIVEWGSDYWTNVYQLVQEVQEEFSKKKEGFSFRDLQKAIVASLEMSVNENETKILPDAQNFKEDLQETIQRRVDDRENNQRNKFQLPHKKPKKPKDKTKEPNKP